MNKPLAQRILDLIYRDPETHRTFKESITDWILDTQPRNTPLQAGALLEYLSTCQPEVLNRLKVNVYIKEDLALALESVGNRN